MARDTSWARKRITRDIPNVGEEALRNLDRSRHRGDRGRGQLPGDILVGKVTPKGEPDDPEEAAARHLRREGLTCATLPLRLPPA